MKANTDVKRAIEYNRFGTTLVASEVLVGFLQKVEVDAPDRLRALIGSGSTGLAAWRRAEGAGFERLTPKSAERKNSGLAVCLASRRVELDGRAPTPAAIWAELKACGYTATSALWPGSEGGYVTTYERKAIERGLLLVGSDAARELTRRKSLQPAPGSTVNVEQQDLSQEELKAFIRDHRLYFPDEVATSTKVVEVRRRCGQTAFRELVLEMYGATCAVCDITDTNLLEASHIIGWSERADTRGYLGNALCLCCFHHQLFDKGYWSLTDDLHVVRKASLTSATIRALLPANTSLRPPTSNPPASEYVRHHRTRHRL